jgi:hypothetical protein
MASATAVATAASFDVFLLGAMLGNMVVFK